MQDQTLFRVSTQLTIFAPQNVLRALLLGYGNVCLVVPWFARNIFGCVVWGMERSSNIRNVGTFGDPMGNVPIPLNVGRRFL